MTSWIAVQVRLSGLICKVEATAMRAASRAMRMLRRVASTTATPAMVDHDVSVGGIHDASQAGTEALNDAEQREPAEPEYEALDEVGADRIRLEPDTDLGEHAFDALAVGEEDKRAEVEERATGKAGR